MATNPINTTDTKARILGAVDVGTSAIRLVIGQTFADGRWEVLERLQRSIRLGQDTFRRGRLRTASMQSAVSILRDYREVLRRHQVQEVRAVATSAVREAANGEAFLDRVLMATDIDVQLISVAEESRLTTMAVRDPVAGPLKQRKNALIVEVGGGSTVLTLLAKGEIQACHSLPIGPIRTQEILGTTDEQGEQRERLIHHQVASTLSALANLLSLSRIQTFIAVGTDARWLAKTLTRNTKLSEVTTVTRTAFDGLVGKCLRSRPEKLTKRYGLSFGEVENLIPSLLIHQGILHATAARKIIVPHVSMQDGLLLDLVYAGSETHLVETSQPVLASARSMADKYGCKCEHNQNVAALAADLFDTFRQDHRLTPRFRLLLQVAAILHEVGMFVSSRSHHKHTLYLIGHSEVFGLTQEELLIVANVARYHRRSRPKTSHPDYMNLSRENRMVVNKLAALLRVADALDASRGQQIARLETRIDGEVLWINTQPGGDFTLEKRSLRNKSNLFQDIYGLTVQIEEGAMKAPVSETEEWT
jgi:exopolyphosphatase/guanosine-5'-triphosphate,3'-diphosphate pyrophosphatase